MILYVRVEKGQPKRPVSVRVNYTSGKLEYCFGRNCWRLSAGRAWRAYLAAQADGVVVRLPGAS